jgi:hypothetical protein
MDALLRPARARSIERYISLYGEDDICSRCDNELWNKCCNKCGDCVCTKDTCCMIFPDKFNTTFVVCKRCIDSIDAKLQLVIDMGKIECLKQKIKSAKTKKQQWAINSIQEGVRP